MRILSYIIFIIGIVLIVIFLYHALFDQRNFSSRKANREDTILNVIDCVKEVDKSGEKFGQNLKYNELRQLIENIITNIKIQDRHNNLDREVLKSLKDAVETLKAYLSQMPQDELENNPELLNLSKNVNELHFQIILLEDAALH